MPKSATEQFQIKKKRKHPLSVNDTTLLHKSHKRYVHSVSLSSDLLIKENYSEFQIDDKESKLNSLLQVTSKADTIGKAASPTVSDSKCITLRTTTNHTYKAKPIDVAPTLDVTRTKNCLRDQTQVLCHDNMPLSHGFYVKGALANKRGLKAFKTNGASGSTTAADQNHEEAKRPRRGNENIKLHTSSLMAEQTSNNLQLSYLLGESLARHGRLQEGFDIYALIASEQPEGFIPLEKLNILATALLDHIRNLSSNSKKSLDLLDSQSNPLKATTTTMDLTQKSSNNEQLKLVTPVRYKYNSSMAANAFSWQLAALSTPSSKLTDLGTDFLASGVGGNLDLHAPSRELTTTDATAQATEVYDPLMCPLCRDVLRCPVTTNCGHTFCRQCCETITMCNICHVKFPRWQKDDYINDTMTSNHLSNSSHNKSAVLITSSLGTLSTATTTSNSINLNTMAPNSNNNNQQFYTSETSHFSTSSSSTTSFSASTLASYHNDLPRLQIITTPLASPTTVTTTTIACTTDTATTTMASTASTSGVALRSSSSHDNMKFMPDVLVRRLVEKWWGCDLQAKKINETATSYMHLNLLDDALKFCNASLEKYNQHITPKRNKEGFNVNTVVQRICIVREQLFIFN